MNWRDLLLRLAERLTDAAVPLPAPSGARPQAGAALAPVYTRRGQLAPVAVPAGRLRRMA